ncbi:MAG TPA: hypothetical protein VK348_10555, partial [Planctomycetota bacterium]|nr:hypothetical protein [Planctomycetota bacterium]
SLGPDPGRADDREYWLAEEASHQLVQWDRLRGGARFVDGGKQVVSHDKEQGITAYEARIPWSDILPAGKPPAAGLVFDLQVVINDFDEATDAMPQTRIGWTFGCGPVIDPGVFGSVVLLRDAKDLEGHMPEVPPRPRLAPPADGPAYWNDVLQRLAKSAPAVHDGSVPPESIGGLDRIKLLEQLDDHAERFPRVDWIELHYRIHRRMMREVAGISATGLPYFWHQALKALSARAEVNPPDGTTRIHRLPMGGWLVRSSKRNFAIDPAGADLAHWLWGGMEFVVLTQPLDITRRNDQLLIRMLAEKQPRPFLTHAVFHLPMVKMDQIRVVEPGASYGQDGGVQVQALGRKGQDGTVPYSLGYRIALPNGTSIVLAGPSLVGDELPKEHSTALLLSPRNANAAAIARAADVELVLIDDLFLPQTFPQSRRVRLTDAFALQKDILPRRSVLLAPGESWDLTAGK